MHVGFSEKPISEEGTLCIIGRLWTDRSYNTMALIETMKKLWNPTKGIKCSELGFNMISFQFHSKRDMMRVLDREPWHFNKHVLALKPLQADIQPSAMQFDTVPFWMRIYDLPLMGKSEPILQQIGSRFGEVIEIDKTTMNGITRSVRLKIMLNLDKPLKRGTKVQIGKTAPCWIPATYERLPSFCYWCGKLGHNHKDCEKLLEKEESEGTVDVEKLPYGDWLRSSPMKISQGQTNSNSTNREELRKSLFPTPPQHTKADVQQTNEEYQSTEQQVSELLTSLKRVEVSGRQGGSQEKQGSGEITVPPSYDDKVRITEPSNNTYSKPHPNTACSIKITNTIPLTTNTTHLIPRLSEPPSKENPNPACPITNTNTIPLTTKIPQPISHPPKSPTKKNPIPNPNTEKSQMPEPNWRTSHPPSPPTTNLTPVSELLKLVQDAEHKWKNPPSMNNINASLHIKKGTWDWR